MVDRLKVHHINIFFLSLLIILNIYTGIIERMGLIYYTGYVFPFVAGIILYSFFRTFMIDALLFIIASALTIFVGTWGNLTGAIFLCFAFYCCKDETIIIITIFCTLIAIISKMLIDENVTIIRTVLYILGYAYIILHYYILIHPKKKINLTRLNEDDINIMIIDFLMSGDRLKEIADKINLSQNAVTKRIEKMRDKYNAGNNIQLIISLIRKGKIGLN
jgi:hypothetical protein